MADKITGNQFVDNLNRGSEKILNGLAWAGRKADYYGISNRHSSKFERIASNGGGVNEAFRVKFKSENAIAAKKTGIPQSVLDESNYIPSRPNFYTKSLRHAGGLLDSVTNGGTFLSEFNQEHQSNSRSYRKTMTEGLQMIAATSSSYAAGHLAAAGTIGLAGSVLGTGALAVSAPIVIGIGAGLLAGKAVNGFLNWLRS